MESVSNSIFIPENIDAVDYCENCHYNYKISSLITFDWQNILPDPLPNSHNNTIEELLYLSELTKYRNTYDLDLIDRIDKDPTIDIKNLCQQYNLVFPQEYFDNFYKETKNLILTIKAYFNRPRPKQLADLYNIPIDTIDSKTAKTPSYPSGHTVYARLASNIVQSLWPEFHKVLYDKVLLVAYARCCQGVHFPSDNKASILLADYLFNRLQSKIKV